MLVNGSRSESSPVELAPDPENPQSWVLSVQVPPTEIRRFAELLEHRDPVELMFRLDELERYNLRLPWSRAVVELRGKARLQSFPHTEAGGSARFQGADELRAA
jgi:hypothetical protein